MINENIYSFKSFWMLDDKRKYLVLFKNEK